MSEWNPRYLAYCKAHQRDPHSMLEFDLERWPGGCMTGFIFWIQARWAEFAKIRPEMDPAIRTSADHAAFDEWLAETYEPKS